MAIEALEIVPPTLGSSDHASLRDIMHARSYPGTDAPKGDGLKSQPERRPDRALAESEGMPVSGIIVPIMGIFDRRELAGPVPVESISEHPISSQLWLAVPRRFDESVDRYAVLVHIFIGVHNALSSDPQ